MHFGEGDGAHMRTDRRLDILDAERQGPVDAHDHVEAAFLMEATRGIMHHEARCRLFMQRYAVFEIEVNGVGLQREGLFEVLGHVGRHKVQRPPGR